MEQRNPLGLYIHIPFCMKKCSYCDFLSFEADKSIINSYVNVLIKEIERYKELAGRYEVRTIFIGGGTPSYIHEKFIVNILETIYKVFEITPINIDKRNIEITIEANPGTLSKEKLKAYFDIGINRLSIGLQSTDNQELLLLGRIHTVEQFLENYHIARETGFGNINIDLMSALPGQTTGQWITTLNRIIKLNPEHISAYSLIIEEGTPFFERYHNKEHLLPSEETDRMIYKMTKDKLSQAGYTRYEISNYARNGFESKHNNSYWTNVEYIGIGLGASSLLNHTRFHNETKLDEYLKLIKEEKSIRKDIEQLSKKQQMEEFMFLGLRRMQGISIIDFQRRFDSNIEDIYQKVIARLIKEGLLSKEENRIFLTNRGIDLSNQVFVEFLQ